MTVATFQVGDIATLNSAIVAIGIGGSNASINSSYTTLSSGITLTADIEAFNLPSGDVVTLVGNGHTLDGSGLYRGLILFDGTVAVQNLTIQHAVAKGGKGGSGIDGGGLLLRRLQRPCQARIAMRTRIARCPAAWTGWQRRRSGAAVHMCRSLAVSPARLASWRY